MIQDGKPPFADPLDDLVKSARNEEGLDRFTGDFGADSQLAAGRTNDDRIECFAIQARQNTCQIPQENAFVSVRHDETDARFAGQRGASFNRGVSHRHLRKIRAYASLIARLS